MNRNEALAQLTDELRNLLRTTDLMLEGAASGFTEGETADATESLHAAVIMLSTGLRNAYHRTEAIDAVTPPPAR